jgi:acetoin utilization protein AcuB
MSAGDLGLVPVRQVMSDRVVAVHAGCSVMRAMDALLGTGLRHLVVVGADGRSRGVVTAERIAVQLMTHAAAPDVTMADLAVARAGNARSGMTVRDAAAAMLEALVDALTVVDEDDRPIGVVTWSDIVRLVARPVPAQPAVAATG